MARRTVLWTVLVSVLLSMAAGISAADDATWKTHQDVNCGVEVKYPATYSLEASGAPDYCTLWIRIGVKQVARAACAVQPRDQGDGEFRSATPLPAGLRDSGGDGPVHGGRSR